MKHPNSIWKLPALATILLGLSLAQSGQAETEYDNEFWISTRTNTENLGTLDNPFDGSTAIKFDTIMSNLPPYSVVHLLAGTYQTRGADNWRLKQGEKLLGNGMDVTTIQLTNANPFGANVIVYAQDINGTNIEVADLTCDCDNSGVAGNYAGVWIVGNHSIVRNVKVVHCSGTSSEIWGISLAGLDETIENCTVSDFLTAGCDGMQIGGSDFNYGSGTIRGNQIIGNLNQEEVGINGSGLNGYLVQDNFIYGIQTAFYNDTGGQTNVTITDNVFKNVRNGVLYGGNGGYTKQNINIIDNTIMLTTNNVGSGSGVWAIAVNYYTTNVSIIGNVVGWDNTPNPGEIGYGYFLDVNPGDQGILAANNRVGSSLWNSDDGTNGISSANGYAAYGNYDFSGNLLTNLSQSLPDAKAIYITPPDAVPQIYGAGSISVGQFLVPGCGLYGWNCSSNLSATLFKPLPLPNEFWSGKTTFVTSWKLLTTNAGNYTFNIGDNYVLANNVSGGFPQKTVSFTAPTGTNITTISATNTIPTSSVVYFQTYIWTGYQIQPGNYSILSGKVTAQ